MWPFIRSQIYLSAIIDQNVFSDPSPLNKSPSIFLRLLHKYHSYIMSPLRKKKSNKHILMLSNAAVLIKPKEEYINRLYDYFAREYVSDTVIFEESSNSIYLKPRMFQDVYSYDWIELKASLKKKSKYSRDDLKTIESLIQYLIINFPYVFKDKSIFENIKRQLLYLSVRLHAYYDLYNQIYDIYNPKVIFFNTGCYGGRSYAIKWARERGIVTAEFQHGLISKEHYSYNFGEVMFSQIGRNYLPEYLLTYGAFWSKQIHFPGETFVVGNPYLSLSVSEFETKINRASVKKILIISSGLVPDKISQIALYLSENLCKSGYSVVVRPHPSEYPALEERYKKLFDSHVTIDNAELYTSIFESDIIVGDASTVLFEALAFNKSIYVFADVCKRQSIFSIFKQFHNHEELLDSIIEDIGIIAFDIDSYFNPKWSENYKNFIDKKVFGK